MTSSQQGTGLAPVEVKLGGSGGGAVEKAIFAAARARVRDLAASGGELTETFLLADGDDVVSEGVTSAHPRRLIYNEIQTGAEKTKPTSSKVDGSVSFTLSMMFGNGDTSTSNRMYSNAGYSKTVQSYIKRSYYSAGLSLDMLQPSSFTLGFAVSAYQLANNTYDFSAAMSFIDTWGKYSSLFRFSLTKTMPRPPR